MSKSILDRTVAPNRYTIGSITEVNFPVSRCADTFDAHRVEGGTEDIVKIDMVFRAGTRFEKMPMEASLCSSMLKEGTQNFSAKQIAETIDFYGAHLEMSLSKDRAEVTLLCMGKHLSHLIDIYTDTFLVPVFPEIEFESIKKRSRSRLAINLEKVAFQSRLIFSKLLFGNSPYRDDVSLDDFDKIDRNDLIDFFQKNYAIDQAYCVISGKNTEQAYSILEGSVSAKKASIRNEPYRELPIQWHYKGGGIEKHEQEGAVQSAIRMGGVAISRNHPDFVPFFITNSILGGYFGSRLMRNIREDKGYTYGIGSNIMLLEEAAYFSISTQVGSEFTIATCDEIHKEICKLCTEGVDADELDLVQQFVAGNLLKHFDGPFPTADRLKDIINYNLKTDEFKSFSSAIFEVGTDDIAKMAQKYFKIEDLSTAIVGKW